jgi:calcineurin-like phosphoesterase family protein
MLIEEDGMARTWFTSDLHIGHEGILSPKMTTRRDFANIRDHDETIVANWNAKVRKDDTVWMLGDFAYKTTEDYARKVFDRLNGTKHLIRGNHEKLGIRMPWASQQDVAHVVVDGQGVWLSHYAHMTWPRIRRGDIHLFGHSHGTLPGTSQSCDVGVDCYGFYPVDLDTIRLTLNDQADLIPFEIRHEGQEETGYDGP